MSASRLALFLLTAACGLLLYHYYGLMPDPMASHFDGAGRPNGFQSRDGFFVLSAALLFGNALLFGIMGPAFRKMPTSWVSLPNRDYFMAEERREETIGFLTRQMEWYGVVTVLLLGAVLGMACAANLESDVRLDSGMLLWLLGAYLVFNAIWLVHFVGHFRAPNAETSAPPVA